MSQIDVPGAGDFPTRADLVVIGGGIVGTATAFCASRAGLKTIVLERKDGLATLTTTTSLECFRAQFSEPENVAMMKASIEVYENFAEVTGLAGYEIGLHQQGYLFLATDAEGAETLRERVAHQQSLGLDDVEFLTGDEVNERFPYTSPTVTGASFRARDGWLSSHEATYGFAKGSKAQFFLKTEAKDILLDGKGVAGVMTERGRVDTRAVVIAAGPFSNQVAGMAGVQLPLTILRRHKVIIGQHPLIPHDAPMTIALASGAHWRPEGPGAGLCWALPEEPSEPMEQVPADWTFPALVMEAVADLSPFWHEVIETLKRENVFLSAGQYTCTLDSKPIIGPHPEVEGLFLNVGYSGHGMMASPDGGRLTVDLILGRVSDEDNPFRLGRFAEGVTELVGEKMTL